MNGKQVTHRYFCTDGSCSEFPLNVIQYISTIRSEQFKQDWSGNKSTDDESFSRFKSDDRPWLGYTGYLNMSLCQPCKRHLHIYL